MTRRPLRAASSVVAAAVVVGLLAGCADSAPDLTDDAATTLQADVLAVSQASAAGDLPAAHAALDTLTGHVASARKRGELSADRQELLAASIVLVSADLTALDQQAAAKARTAAQAAATAAAARAAEAAQSARDRKSSHSKDKD